MSSISPESTVLVLDLDDTIYPEHCYKISGIRSVCRTIASLYPQYNADTLFENLDTSGPWLDRLCSDCGLNDSEKQTLLWHYRLHTPDLANCMPSEQLKNLMARFSATALISDGRSLTQRLKLAALGLLERFDLVLISEATGADKPDGKRFLQVEAVWPGKQYLYIADNTAKDFVTPNRLGWKTLRITGMPDAIYTADESRFPAEYRAQGSLNTLEDLAGLLS